MTDQQILQLLCSGNELKENRALSQLIRESRKYLVPYINKETQEQSDREGIFNEVIMTFFLKVKGGKFQLEGEDSIKRYLYTIAKYASMKAWNDFCKWNGRTEEVKPNNAKEMDSVLKDLENRNRKDFLAALIASLSPRCKEVLDLIYYKKMRHQEVALRMGLQSDQVSRNTLNRCLGSLKKVIKSNKYDERLFQ